MILSFEFRELIGYEIIAVSAVDKLADERIVLDNGDRFDADSAEFHLSEMDDIIVLKHPRTGQVKLLYDDGVLDAEPVARRRI